MPITRLNHAVLYVRDLERTREFYQGVLGFQVLSQVPGVAMFFRAPASANDHDLGVFQIGASAGASTAGRSTVGLYHLGWEVDTLAELARIASLLSERGALVGASDHFTTKAVYARDPDGIELEVCWVVPVDRLSDDLVRLSRGRPAPLDLDREIERYGARTPSRSGSPAVGTGA